MDLRCGSRLQARLEDGFIETRCKSAFCGHERGVVVIHRFSVETGELISTECFKDPNQARKEQRNESSRDRVPVRSS